MTPFSKRILLAVSVAIALGVTQTIFATERLSTDRLDGFPDIESFRLTNGLTLVLWPDSSAKQVGIKLWYKVGALHEKPGITGIAHLFEHMMLRPSQYSPPDGGLAFERTLGAQIGATTRFKTTDFYVALGSENLETMLRYYADTMKNLPLNATMLKNEKEAVKPFGSNPRLRSIFMSMRSGSSECSERQFQAGLSRFYFSPFIHFKKGENGLGVRSL